MRKFVYAFGWLAVLSTAHAQTFEPAQSYDVLLTSSDGSEVGTATIKSLSDTTYAVEWNIEGEVEKGFGVRSNDVLAVSFNWGPTLGVVIYRINCNILDGVFAFQGVNNSGTERLTPKK
jgi:hypothetical protein